MRIGDTRRSYRGRDGGPEDRGFVSLVQDGSLEQLQIDTRARAS